MGFFSSVASFFASAVSDMASGVSSTVQAAANDIGGVVEAASGGTSSAYKPSEEEVYAALRFTAPDNWMPPYLHDILPHMKGIIDVYGKSGRLIGIDGNYYPIKGSAAGEALARRFADFYYNVFLTSAEGKEFVKEFGRPDFRFFGVADLGYAAGAVTLQKLNLMVMNSKMFHNTLVNPSDYYNAIRLLAHESLHQLGDSDEYSTYTRNSAYLSKQAKAAKKRGDSNGARKLEEMAKLEKNLAEHDTIPGRGYKQHNHVHASRSSLESLLEAA